MTPIYQTSTYEQTAPGSHKGYEYGRSQNPTRNALQASLAALENGKHGLCFASGMAATDTVAKLLKPGDEVIVTNDLYGGTYRIFTRVFANYGIKFHFVPMKDAAKRTFYLEKASEGLWSKRELRRQIQRKAFERNEIAEVQVSDTELSARHAFKDPYLLDFLDLHAGYSENDLETAILRDLEQFILELGTGFTFVERQKRIILDGVDFYLDLLFYHRKLKRLIAIELKLDKFKPAYKGQMELYLKWLDRYDKQADENPPIGLILCAEASREQVELLQMHKDGIMVAEYWTELPPKEELERRLHEALIAARERLARKRLDE